VKVAVEVERVDYFRFVDQIVDLRSRTWSAIGVSPAQMSGWRDTHDEHADHFACFEDGRIVGAARFCAHKEINSLPDSVLLDQLASKVAIPSGPIASINRLVVAPECQYRRIAVALDQVRMSSIDERCISTTVALLSMHNGAVRMKMLAKHGFIPVEPWLDHPGVGLTLPVCRIRSAGQDRG